MCIKLKNEFLQNPKFVTFVIVYLSFLLDNVLLTVIVPIIPDYLFSKDVNTSISIEMRSLSPLQRKFENMERDNGPLGALLASKAFVQLAFTPFVGYLTNSFGYNVPLLIGSFNMLAATLLFAYGHTYGILVLARALHGSSSAAIAISGMCLLADTLPKDYRCRLMPLAFGGIALGVLIGYPLGGAAYQFIGKSAPFILIAVFVSANIALQIWNLKRQNVSIKDNSSASVHWLHLLKHKDILIITGAICICTSSMAILEPCVPMWLLATINPPPTKWDLGAVFIPDSVGYFIGSHFAGLIPMLPWRAALMAMLISGLSCCAIPTATSIAQLALPHFGLGLGVGIVDAALVPLLANLVDSSLDANDPNGDFEMRAPYGPVYAMQQASVSLAYFFGPLVGGRAVRTIGFPWLIRFVGFLNVIYCPMLIELNQMTHLNLAFSTSSISYSTLD